MPLVTRILTHRLFLHISLRIVRVKIKNVLKTKIEHYRAMSENGIALKLCLAQS